MSFAHIFLRYSIISILIISGCKDKHSPKNNYKGAQTEEALSPITTHKKTGITKVGPHKKEDKELTTDPSPFRLTNKNGIDFLLEYGKENPETFVRIKTKYGNIEIELYEKCPLHRANFIYLVKQHYFDETFFYRVAKDFVIQGGNSDRNEMAQKRFDIGDYTLPQEPVKGLKHNYGSVALSKQWVDNPSNRSTPYEFFIVIAKNGAHHLDGEHTIFGKVVKGMKIADTISNVAVDSSEWPIENIFIKAEVIR